MKIQISENAAVLLSRLTSTGHSAYIVGGCVRDAVMKRTPFDFDITTNATTDEMLEMFSDLHCLNHGIKHGTVAVVFENEIVECTTYRIDGQYSDGRHPNSVTFSSDLKDDLSRRDFTVNALAYNDDGLIDLFGGTDDIKKKIIRAIGDPDRRFTEDSLRIMRGLRFASTLGFSIEKRTGESMRKNKNMLDHISSERITAEFEKMIVGKDIGYILKNFGDIISYVIPNSVIESEIIKCVENSPAEYTLRLYSLIKNTAEPMTVLENSRIMLKKKDKRTLSQLFSMTPPADRMEIKRLFSRFNTDTVIGYLKTISTPYIVSQALSILENGECYSISQLDISAQDIQSLEFSGRKIGVIQEKILEEVITDRLYNRKNEIIEYLINLK